MARRLIPVEGQGQAVPGHFPTNRIITRGMGVSRGVAGRAGMVTQGYGGPPPFIAQTFRQINLGQSGYKRRLEELDEVIVWAKLVNVNGVEPKKPIKGWIKVKVEKSRGLGVMAEHLGSRVRSVLEVIKVSVQRLK
jgi:hypothetical protein